MDIDVDFYTKRNKAIMIGLFLSRYDKKALASLGFNGFMEAYNIMGYSLGIPPLSIRGYRDEFDPYFPNPRKGWHNRQLRDYCRVIMDKTSKLTFEEFRGIINSYFYSKYVDIKDIKQHETQIRKHKFLYNRLITGKAAEEYFVLNYNKISPFQNYSLKDTTYMGCGFDFKLSLETNNYYIEVKGINEKQGNILMTDKEYAMADFLLDKYCLFVVSNFKEKPFHQLFFNPLKSGLLSFQRTERQITQVSYSASIPYIAMS